MFSNSTNDKILLKCRKTVVLMDVETVQKILSGVYINGGYLSGHSTGTTMEVRKVTEQSNVWMYHM